MSEPRTLPPGHQIGRFAWVQLSTRSVCRIGETWVLTAETPTQLRFTYWASPPRAAGNLVIHAAEARYCSTSRQTVSSAARPVEAAKLLGDHSTPSFQYRAARSGRSRRSMPLNMLPNADTGSAGRIFDKKVRAWSDQANRDRCRPTGRSDQTPRQTTRLRHYRRRQTRIPRRSARSMQRERPRPKPDRDTVACFLSLVSDPAAGGR
jgi:hypothetical protein